VKFSEISPVTPQIGNLELLRAPFIFTCQAELISILYAKIGRMIKKLLIRVIFFNSPLLP
jgi:hypothetical protein